MANYDTHASWRKHATESSVTLITNIRSLHRPADGRFRQFEVVCRRHAGSPPQPGTTCLDCGYQDRIICEECRNVYPCATVRLVEQHQIPEERVIDGAPPMHVEYDEDQDENWLICQRCGDPVEQIQHGDWLSLMLNTALVHEAVCTRKRNRDGG